MSASGQTDAPDSGGFVGLTAAAREQLERYRVAHATQVLTILLSDLEGSTRQQSRLGNVRAAEMVQLHRNVFRRVLADVDGEEVETAGDSFLIVFAAPSEAVKFALHMQAAMRQMRGEEPDLPTVRVGIHQGQVVVERHPGEPKALDIYGLQVSTAARITDLGCGGQILCSRGVFDDARAILRGPELAGLGEVVWCNHGLYRFKGVDDAYEVCEVGERGHAPLTPPTATAKAWPADAAAEELGWRPAVGVTVPGTSWVLEERLGAESSPSGRRRRFRGEFGEVWRARNTADKSLQVFKFCFRRDRLPALKREARLLKQLRKYRHPNLVEVYDVTETERPPHYLEMEYVDGPTLADWLAASPPLSERLEVVAQVADVLDVVHAAGIYHRDIKPSNILLTRRGDGAWQAKLTDFGLGAAEDKDLLKSIESSSTEGVSGTWDYIAPELRLGVPPSPQSDIYSLGVTLFQVVVGDVQRTLGEWEREVPSDVLRDDIRRCIATDPAQRWGRAAELAQALRSHDERLHARELERAHAAQRRRTRRFATAAGLAAVFALVVIVLGGYAWRQRNAAVEANRRMARELYHSNIVLASKYLGEARFGLARPLLWGAPENERNWEWGHLLDRCYQDMLTLEGHQQGISAVGISADGSRFLTASYEGTAKVWDAATGTTTATLRCPERWITHAVFSPDGRLVLTASTDRTARIWDAATGSELTALAGHHPPALLGDPDDARIRAGRDEDTAAFWQRFSDRDLMNALRAPRVAVRLPGGAIASWERLTAPAVRELMIALVNAGTLTAASFSPDGQRAVTAGGDGTARLWDTRTGACLHLLPVPRRRAAAPAAPASPEELCSWLAGLGATSIVFDPTGARAVVAAVDGTAEVWDAEAGTRLLTLTGHRAAVQSARFSADGRRVVTASRDQTAAIWDAQTGTRLKVLQGHRAAVLDAWFTPDGSRVVTAAENYGGAVWDAASAEMLHAFEGLPHGISPDGVRAAATRSGWVMLIDVRTGEKSLEAGGHDGLVRAIAFSRDGSLMLTGGDDGTARLWATVPRRPEVLTLSPRQPFGDAAFGGGGRCIVAAARDRVVVWDAAAGRELLSASARAGPDVSGQTSPDGSLLAVLTAAGGAEIWDVAGRRVIATLNGHAAYVHNVRFSPDGRLLVTASDDRTARVWDAAGRPVAELKGHTEGVWDAAFDAAGRRVVTAGNDRTARVWDAATGCELAVLGGHTRGLYGAAFSPDGSRVVTSAADKTARVWDAGSGRLLATLEGHIEAPWRACFSPDGAIVLTAARDATARLWDAATGRELHVLRRHASGIYSARFSPDGSRILTTGDTTARVWDAATGRELIVFTEHSEVVNAAAFSPDGTRVVTASEDGTLRIWHAMPWRLGDLSAAGTGSWEKRFRCQRLEDYRRWLRRCLGAQGSAAAFRQE